MAIGHRAIEATGFHEPGRFARVRQWWEQEHVFGYGLILPAFMLIAILVAFPFGMAIYFSLSDYWVGSPGRFVGLVSGPAYAAAKHGVVAMSYSINMEEFQHGIRSTVLCPAEVATPILDLRPKPVSAEERARMIQPEHMADLIVYVAKLPATVCMNEVVISPTWNRGYAHSAGLGPSRT